MLNAYEKEEILQTRIIEEKLREVYCPESASQIADYAILQTSTTMFRYRFGSIDSLWGAGLVFVNMGPTHFWLLDAFKQAVPEDTILAEAGVTDGKIVTPLCGHNAPYSFLVIVDNSDPYELEDLMRKIHIRRHA